MLRMNLQVKFSLSYIAIIIAVLLMMNTYPLAVSEDLVFRSKEATLKSSVSVMTTALTGLGELSEESVAPALTVAEQTGISRVLVTDAAGRILLLQQTAHIDDNHNDQDQTAQAEQQLAPVLAETQAEGHSDILDVEDLEPVSEHVDALADGHIGLDQDLDDLVNDQQQDDEQCNPGTFRYFHRL